MKLHEIKDVDANQRKALEDWLTKYSKRIFDEDNNKMRADEFAEYVLKQEPIVEQFQLLLDGNGEQFVPPPVPLGKLAGLEINEFNMTSADNLPQAKHLKIQFSTINDAVVDYIKRSGMWVTLEDTELSLADVCELLDGSTLIEFSYWCGKFVVEKSQFSSEINLIVYGTDDEFGSPTQKARHSQTFNDVFDLQSYIVEHDLERSEWFRMS